MTDPVRVRLLGPAQVEREGRGAEPLAPGKALALLGYLAVRDQPLSREHLADLLWPDLPAGRGRANLSWLLHQLNDRLPGCLDAGRHTLQFQRGPACWLDLDAFASLLARGDAPALAQAVGLYQGDLLEGLHLDGCADFELWLVGERERWRRRAARALRALARHHSERGEHRRALRYARRLLDLEPWLEEAHCQVMRLLALRGRRAAALAQYEACRRVLAEALGVEPGPETTRLYEQIRAGEVMGPAPALPPSLSVARRQNLPAQATPFVGRKAELAELARLLVDPDVRLLTILGAGGMGKTRLALEAAAAQMGNFAHGVYLVSLGPLQTTEAIVPTVAEALGFSFYQRGEARQQLLDYLRHKAMLVVMDRFEHLLDGADLVSDILKRAPEVKILSTSRARLHMQGEHLFHLAGMDVPDWEMPADAVDAEARGAYDAVELFLQGARRARPGFEPTNKDLPAIARICRLVQGMPLGILLAAAWLEMLSPVEIADQISGDMGQSLDFLETDLRDVPARQRSMRAVFDHSWKLLSEREREVFQALSVFRGGFTREAAEQVTGASLRALRALVDKSLLERDPTGRYGIHELLRQYAADKLGEMPAQEQAARDRHCDHYAAFLCQKKEGLKGPRQKATLKDIGLEMGNVRAGWNWAVSRGKVEQIADALESLYLFYDMQYWFQEGAEAFGKAVTTLGGPDAGIDELGRDKLIVLGQVMAAQASFSWWSGSDNYAAELDKKSTDIFLQLDLWDEMLLLCHGYVYGHERGMGTLLRKGIAHWRKEKDKWRLSRALRLLGVSCYHRGEHEESRDLVQESLAIGREVGDPRELAMALYTLGYVLQRMGEYQEAGQYFRESVAVSREIDDLRSVALFLDHLGWVTRLVGDFEEAERCHSESLAIAQEIGDLLGVAGSLDNLSLVAYDLGAYTRAERLCKEGLVIRRDFGHQWSIAVSLQNLGSISVAQGDYQAAETYFREALGIFSQEQTPLDSLTSLVGLAALLARKGRTEWAIEITALASRYPLVGNSRCFEEIVRQHITIAAADLPPETVSAAQARGRTRDLDATVAELLTELGGAGDGGSIGSHGAA